MKRIRAEIGHVGRLRAREIGPLRIRTLVRRMGGMSASFWHLAMQPNTSHPALLHRKTEEFLFVIGGSARAVINGERCRLRRGSFAFLPRGAAHQFHAGSKGTEVLALFVPALDLNNPDIAPVAARRSRRGLGRT
ncbi:MAG: cupin domain-containing protein [Elusimicrobia bacterium]|nr:cupin domain-containing protein [Elusimicrobiota bacterium]